MIPWDLLQLFSLTQLCIFCKDIWGAVSSCMLSWQVSHRNVTEIVNCLSQQDLCGEKVVVSNKTLNFLRRGCYGRDWDECRELVRHGVSNAIAPESENLLLMSYMSSKSLLLGADHPQYSWTGSSCNSRDTSESHMTKCLPVQQLLK